MDCPFFSETDKHDEEETQSKRRAKCRCVQDAVNRITWPQDFKQSPGYLSLSDWLDNPHIWLHYVESWDGLLLDDDVLMSTDTRYWSIHDVQRYFYGDLHCEKLLFTYQYPNLRMPTKLGSYLWKANTALKLPPALYQKELRCAIEVTLKKMETEEAQMDRIIISDQLINLDRMDFFKRKTFFRILINLLCSQNHLQLVSLENLCCRRLEGVKLLEQLSCFNAHSLKYLFLWRFFMPNENPLLINYSYITDMTTDEEKSQIAKLLQELEVPEIKLSERCSDLIKDFHQKYDKVVDDEEQTNNMNEVYENPYRVDKKLLEENERKLRDLLSECKRAKIKHSDSILLTGADPKRPWRVNTNKEKLLRIDNELKQHIEKDSQLIVPLGDDDMKELVKDCQQETLASPPVSSDRLRHTVDAARKNLSSGQYIPRPDTKHCFLRSLGSLFNLRLLALEFSHIADGTGGALISLLPILKRPHFRLQLICREDHIPGRADAALGVSGYGIPDTAWRRVHITCPNLYLLMAFFRVRDYDNVRRFLSPSIPMRETHLTFGIDLKMRQRQDSDISCFVRHIAHFYASTLVSLSIHQWRFAVFPLRRIFELMPRLARFHYIGRVEDDVDLKRMLMIVSCGVCDKLKHLKVEIQDDEQKRDYWRNVVESLNKEYADIMKLFEIHLCIKIYKN